MIPDAVRQLILEKIDSVSEMEALLLLRTHKADSWTSEQLAERLYISVAEAEFVLEGLTRKALFCRDDEVTRYGPATPELEAAVDELAETYRTRLIPLTRLIHSKAASSLQHFANAFRLRKEP